MSVFIWENPFRTEMENYLQNYTHHRARGRPLIYMGFNEQYGGPVSPDVPKTWQNLEFPYYYQHYSNTITTNNGILAAPQWLPPMKLYELPQKTPRKCEHVTFRQDGLNLFPQEIGLECNALLSDKCENANALNMEFAKNNGAGTLLSGPKMIGTVTPRVVPFSNFEERPLNPVTYGGLNNQQPALEFGIQGNSNYKINQWNSADGEGSSYDENSSSVLSHVSATCEVPQQNTTPTLNNVVANKQNAQKNPPRPRRIRASPLNTTERTLRREFDKILRATTREMDTKSLLAQHPLCPRTHIKYALSIAKFNYLKADLILKIAKSTRPGLEHIVNVLTLNHLVRASGKAPENRSNEWADPPSAEG